ncbi:MAG: hypothetical protein RL266_2014 [Bacteroidota bacterium]|jgi:hypothetical protein
MGIIPADFTTSSTHKYEQAKRDLGNDADATQTKKAKVNFLLESNFLIDQVLNSGRVLFNDPVSEYLDGILSEILKTEPELKQKLRVYAVRSTMVNSFTTDDGIILVNVGLVAQLETEAQLAFILCHEISHFTENHVINAYVKREEIKESDGQVKRSIFDEKLLGQSQYSKELEKEADRLGLQRFLNTEYTTTDVSNVFEVMRYAHLPFDDLPFDRKFFDHGFYRINESYYLNKVRPVEALDADLSSETHPSPLERQQLLATVLARHGSRTGQSFILGKERFDHIRNICRFELSDLYLKANNPIRSIYNSYLLQRSFPDNVFLQETIARSLYRLSKYKSGGNYGFVHPGFSHIEGESQQLFHMLYRLEPEELCVLATGHVWRTLLSYPQNKDLERMADDLLHDLMRQYYVPGMFSRSEPAEGWDTPDTTNIASKYDRLKEKAKDNPRLSMITYALVDLFQNDDFRLKFDSLELNYWGSDKQAVNIGQIKQEGKSDLRQWKNHGFSLGATKVVVVSPTYSKLDLRKKQQHMFLHSESAKDNLIKQIGRSAKLLNLDVQIIDRSELDSSDIDAFNDITFLNEWVDARFTDIDVGMVNLPTHRVNELIEKYGTEHFTWTGVINYRENKPLMYFYLLYALIPPAIPFAIYYLARPNFDMYYYCITFNLRTGQPEQVNYSNYRKRDARDMINSSVYDSFWQMRRPSKSPQ